MRTPDSRGRGSRPRPSGSTPPAARTGGGTRGERSGIRRARPPAEDRDTRCLSAASRRAGARTVSSMQPGTSGSGSRTPSIPDCIPSCSAFSRGRPRRRAASGWRAAAPGTRTLRSSAAQTAMPGTLRRGTRTSASAWPADRRIDLQLFYRVRRSCLAARRPVSRAPSTVPPRPVRLVASPAKKSVSSSGAASRSSRSEGAPASS